MLNVYLCDDNGIVLEKYKKLLLQIAEQYHIFISIQTFISGEQLLFHLEEAPDSADIIYLDILMDGRNGIDTAKKLREYGSHAEIIFLTANSEYVFESFDVSPTNYILKDTVSDVRFREIFFKAAILADKKVQTKFCCECGSVKKQILINKISYFEVRNRMVTVHFDSTAFDFYSRLEDLEKDVNLPNFIRVHRSYLVHLQYIEQMNKAALQLVTGESIPLGVTYTKNVKLALSRYLNQFH